MTAAEVTTDYERLSAVLWRQRGLLETLEYRLEVEQALLRQGRFQWLARATREVGVALTALRACDVERAAAVAALSRGPEGADAPLSALVADAPPPWAGLLAEHHDALLRSCRAVRSLAAANHDLLHEEYRALRDRLGERAVGKDTATR